MKIEEDDNLGNSRRREELRREEIRREEARKEEAKRNRSPKRLVELGGDSDL